MRKFYLPMLATALLVGSCQKELGGNDPASVAPTSIPADFDWQTTCDMEITVEAPVVDGSSNPDYAVVRVFCSPILTDENMVAKGVATASVPFRTALTVPAGAQNVYVQTTLPDGTKAVRMYPVREQVLASSVAMNSHSAPVRRMPLAESALLPSDMPACPELALRTESDFAPQAVIRTIESGKSYQLGASWAFHAAAEYFIPADAQIVGSVDLSGNHAPFRNPVLYVAGKLTLGKAQIGGATLAVLPGGEVIVDKLETNAITDNPVLHVFEGGKFTADKANFSGRVVVNKGTIEIVGKEGELDVNNSVIYNAASAVFSVRDAEFTKNSICHNDGRFTAEDVELNAESFFYNYANGSMEVTDGFKLTNSSVLRQDGLANFDDLEADGGSKVYINCYTVADEVDGEGALFYFGAGAGFDAREVELQNTQVEMASGSIFTMDEYNADGQKGGAYITGTAAEGQLPAVVVIREKAVSSQWWGTKFRNRIEVVYTNRGGYSINKGSLTGGAVMRSEQTVVIPECRCNGGKDPVVPEPEPEPAEEYELVPGAAYTYCFEDNWPWFGDYDMNDLVVVANVGRNISKDGGKVKSVVIEWEPKAAGTTYKVAFAVQLDQVRASEVASVVSTFGGFGSGPFASQGLEPDHDLAVISLYNDTKEVLAGSNTWPGQNVPTTRYTTTVEFTQPVDASAVVESAMNFFIAVKERSNEIHMPGYCTTALGAVTGKGCTLPSDPFKFYTASGERMSDNYMMWALRIPGDFRYPAEGKDIRTVYDEFLPWAASNGMQYIEWYDGPTNESLIY